MTLGWMSLGVVAGGLVGAGVGVLAAGPAGLVAGGVFGAVVGAALAVMVLLLALITYTIRAATASPPRTAAQHVRAFIVPPTLLMTAAVALEPGISLFLGLPLLVGLLRGPRVVRNGLRRRLRNPTTHPTIPHPRDPFVDSPREVT
jgi:hypothetical protein